PTVPASSFSHPPTPYLYTLSLHDALPIYHPARHHVVLRRMPWADQAAVVVDPTTGQVGVEVPAATADREVSPFRVPDGVRPHSDDLARNELRRRPHLPLSCHKAFLLGMGIVSTPSRPRAGARMLDRGDGYREDPPCDDSGSGAQSRLPGLRHEPVRRGQAVLRPRRRPHRARRRDAGGPSNLLPRAHGAGAHP